MQRLDNILRSATFNAYGEALDGLSTIRATRREEYFTARTDGAIDLKNQATYIAAVMSM